MEKNHKPSVPALRALVAASPIVVAAAPRDFTDWCRRQPADIDAVILDWLRAQRPRPAALT